MNTEKQNMQSRKFEQIDFGAIWTAIKKYKKLYYKALAIAFVAGCIISYSIPKTFKCQILLAPETKTSSLSGLASLATSFGVNLGNVGSNNGVDNDAITPLLYPDLMKSVDFKTSLFPVKVWHKKDKQPMTYYDYLKNEWRDPWWSNFFGLLAPKKEKDTLVNNFELTPEQARIARIINQNVVCKIDKKTNIITIDVTAQDPYVVALLADSVQTRLQDFITEYRTKKARHDLEYFEKLHRSAKKDYERVRQIYVDFMDSNQDVVLQSVRQKQTDLENEMQLQYNNYTAVSAQVLNAQAKVQEETPSFTTLQRATVPLGIDGPNSRMIIMVLLLITFLGVTFWVLKKEHLLRNLLGLS